MYKLFFRMARKINLQVIEKYDISNKIFNELADYQSRSILFSIIKKPKTPHEISRDLKIPRSTVYNKIEKLFQLSLVSVKRDFSDNGRIFRYYQSKIDDVKISISKFEPSISLKKNPKARK